MTKKEKRLATYFLNKYADECGNHGCNDLPQEAIQAADFTPEEAETFAKEFVQYNTKGREQYDPNLDSFERMSDFSVIGLLAHKLETE